MRQLYVYILASHSRTLYVGVTNNLQRRMFEHKSHAGNFTSRYRADRLVYFETVPGALTAISREKQLKGWTRERKMRLIETQNPAWRDLAVDWFEQPSAKGSGE